MCSDEQGCQSGLDCSNPVRHQIVIILQVNRRKSSKRLTAELYWFCEVTVRLERILYCVESNTRSFIIKMVGTRVRSTGPVTQRIRPSSPHKTADLITVRWANTHHYLRVQSWWEVYFTCSPQLHQLQQQFIHTSIFTPAQLESLLVKCLVHSVFPLCIVRGSIQFTYPSQAMELGVLETKKIEFYLPYISFLKKNWIHLGINKHESSGNH